MNRARAITGGQAFVPFNVGGTAATLDMNFRAGGYVGAQPSDLTVTRAGIATAGLFTDAAGSGYTVFAPNTARIISGSGLLIEEARTQYLGVTDTPATQTTTSLGTGSYTLWVIGSGTATPSAGTATITGAAAASAGTPNTFTVTVAGTVTVTVSGSLTRFQLENGLWPTTYIPNLGAAGTTVVRAQDLVSLTGGNFSSWYTNTSAGTFFAEGSVSGYTLDTHFPVLASADDGTGNNRITLFQAASASSLNLNVRTSSVSATLSDSGRDFVAGQVSKVVGAYSGTTLSVSANGQAVVTGTQANGVPVGMTALRIGGNSSLYLNQLSGLVRRVAYFPARLADGVLSGMTG